MSVVSRVGKAAGGKRDILGEVMTPHSCKELYDKIKDRPEYQRELELYDLEEEMTRVFEDILENSKETDPAFTKTVDDHFWELL